MIRIDCARRASAISLLATLVVVFSASPANARSHHHRAQVPVPTARPAPDNLDYAAPPQDGGVMLSDPILSIVSEDVASSADTPTIVKPARRIYCVEFARVLSGISIFGDAKTWWDKARSFYAQSSSPLPGSVMVFAGTRKMNRGHVAVVRRIVSDREIRVDHANWGRDGKIYLNAPVIDVSANNDWSRVRVWNTRAGTMGSSTYSIKGFITPQPVAIN